MQKLRIIAGSVCPVGGLLTDSFSGGSSYVGQVV